MSNAKPIMMKDVRDAFFPEAYRPARNMYDNRSVLRAFNQGRIIGVPTKWQTRNGKKFVKDFKITRAEWRRLHEEGIRAPLDHESEVAV